MSDSQTQLSFSIIDSAMTVQAMRDSGYKSTTHALAELIDNSIESGATSIEVFGVSDHDSDKGRYALRELAVLDNGEGMDAETLRGALRYGHGTRRARRSIGRFGLGLPNSSMSQAKCLDVWSWRSGVTNALHTKLHIEEVEDGVAEIPEPALRAIPEIYLQHSRHGFDKSDSGTLVVWRELDRVEWRRASTTFKHTEMLIGRLYRRFLAKESERLYPDDQRGTEIGPRRSIFLIPLEDTGGTVKVDEQGIVEVRPNDPLYLMTETSCPEDFGPGPMFVELEGSPFSVDVKYEGKAHSVQVRASYARPHVRDESSTEAAWPEKFRGWDSGATSWGKHALQNQGVSLVRAHREIQLDESWISGNDPRERWWKIEIDFPTALDEVFGVTNNKQGAMTFQRLARYDWNREALPDEKSSGDVRRRMELEGDLRVHLLNLRQQVGKAIALMRSRVQEARQRRGPRHELNQEQKADAKATEAIKRRIEENHPGKSDLAGKTGTTEEHKEAQFSSLIEKHKLDRADALERINETIEAENRVRLIESEQSSPAFFDIDPLPNVLQVALNTNHPVHSHLWEVMHPKFDDGMSEDDLRERLARTAAAFRILIYAWARYEDEQTERDRRKVRDARLEWGKYAEEFFEEDDGQILPTDLV